jgi:hypothetical protein
MTNARDIAKKPAMMVVLRPISTMQIAQNGSADSLV